METTVPHPKNEERSDNTSSSKGPKKAEKTGKKKKIVLGSVVLLLIGAGGYFAYDRYTYVTTDDATVEAHTTMLSPKVAGIVTGVFVEEHQPVKAGQVLVQLEQKDYKADLASAEANLGSVQAQFQNAKADYERSTQLIRAHAITRQAYDRAQATFNELDRKVKAAQAQVELQRLNLSYTTVHAPADGYIARKSVEPGMYAGKGVSLMGFVPNDDRWVIANYKETDLESIQPGKRVKVSIDAINGKTYEAYVESISPATGATFTLLPPENATGNFTKVVQRVPVRIRFKDLPKEDFARLQAGLSANVSVLKHSEPQAVPSPNRTQSAGVSGS